MTTATMTKAQMIDRMFHNGIIDHDQLAEYTALTEAEVRDVHDEHLGAGLTEIEFRDTLLEAISESIDFDGEVRSIRTFEDVGLLTLDQGLVVRMNDGAEFHLTIQTSNG